MQTTIQNNLKIVRENIIYACGQAGRDPQTVQILAATKTVPAETIHCLPRCGVTMAGENRVQEFLGKEGFVQDVSWHFIGSLQTNKVKQIVGKVALIHSLDRKSLADEIQRVSKAREIVQDCLIEINAAGEENKSGVMAESLFELYQYVKKLPNIRVCGFMPVLPVAANEILYKQMQKIFSDYASIDPRITVLSMGMSGDYQTAIRHGATIVRLGSCIFGEREYQKQVTENE